MNTKLEQSKYPALGDLFSSDSKEIAKTVDTVELLVEDNEVLGKVQNLIMESVRNKQ